MIVIIKGRRVYLPILLRVKDRRTTLVVTGETARLVDADATYETIRVHRVKADGETLVFSNPEKST